MLEMELERRCRVLSEFRWVKGRREERVVMELVSSVSVARLERESGKERVVRKLEDAERWLRQGKSVARVTT